MGVAGGQEPVGGRRWDGLVGRRRERAALDGLLKTVLARGSQALVVHGEPGVGKTALLDYLAGRAHGCRVARAVGVQSEMELAFAGLHQLCANMLTTSSGFRRRSGTRCAQRSVWQPARLRTDS